MEFDLAQLRELLTILNQTDINELCLKSQDFELSIRKGDRPEALSINATNLAPETAPPAPPLSSSPAVQPTELTSTSTAPTVDKRWVDVVSPMVGTFYRAPGPEEPPFVEVGESVKRGQTVCIIEAMKLLNELEAELNGQVMEILVQNGQPIEFGQILMRINPS